MLEVTHAHLVTKALVLLLLTHLVIFSALRTGTKQFFIWGAFGAALVDEAGGWLVRFASPALAPLKVAGFLSLQMLLALLLMSLAWSLLGTSRDSQALRGREGAGGGEEQNVCEGPVEEAVRSSQTLVSAKLEK